MAVNRIPAEKIFAIRTPGAFGELALEIFAYQAMYNPVYSRYLELMNFGAGDVKRVENIPFLPVELFKSHRVVTGEFEPEIVFESSGTAGMERSRHFLADASLYRKSFGRTFRHFYGDPSDYCILALLPSYLERSDSSLVYMTRHLIRESQHPDSGFYLDEFRRLADRLKTLESSGQKSLLLGVSFALLDLAEQFPMPLEHTIVMETGGMKGRREEITREELHSILGEAFSLGSIHSEYGMTELLSQAYSKGKGIFHPPPWMKIMIRDPYDPLSSGYRGTSGGINIIDLANIHSCAFLSTGDSGKVHRDGGFEVLGRLDDSEIRGCNLMIG